MKWASFVPRISIEIVVLWGREKEMIHRVEQSCQDDIRPRIRAQVIEKWQPKCFHKLKYQNTKMREKKRYR